METPSSFWVCQINVIIKSLLLIFHNFRNSRYICPAEKVSFFLKFSNVMRNVIATKVSSFSKNFSKKFIFCHIYLIAALLISWALDSVEYF